MLINTAQIYTALLLDLSAAAIGDSRYDKSGNGHKKRTMFEADSKKISGLDRDYSYRYGKRNMQRKSSQPEYNSRSGIARADVDEYDEEDILAFSSTTSTTTSAATTSAVIVDTDCCEEKMVSGVLYKLLDHNPAATKPPYNCQTTCVYASTEGEIHTIACFRGIDMKSDCAEQSNTSTTTTSTVTTATTNTTTTNTATTITTTTITTTPFTIGGSTTGFLMMGGMVNGSRYSTNVEILGECSGYSTQKLKYGRMGGSAAKRGDKIYICGGSIPSSKSTNSCEVRDINTGDSSTGPSMNIVRLSFTMANVDSTIVAVGGYSIESVEVLEPDSDKWTLKSYTISPGRRFLASVVISSSSLLLVGGLNDKIFEDLKLAEALNIKSGKVTKYPDLPRPMRHPSSVFYQNKVYVVGGGGTTGNSLISLDLRYLIVLY